MYNVLLRFGQLLIYRAMKLKRNRFAILVGCWKLTQNIDDVTFFTIKSYAVVLVVAYLMQVNSRR
jgi:hypothetical protein